MSTWNTKRKGIIKMTNSEIMTLSLKRINVCDICLALTSLICEMNRELKDESTSEYRKTVVLPGSNKKWETLRAEIVNQFDEQDKEEI
jgi:hypothetical protein